MRKPILAFLLLTLCLIAIANGQGTASRVTGTVVDEKGSVVPGAVVTLTNEATQLTLTTDTGSGGTYVFDSVQVGKYTVAVEKQGFKKSVSVGNTANINQPLTVNFTLEVGGVSEAVQTSSSGNIGNTVEQRTLVTLPIVGNRGRNPLEFINFQPGVVTGSNTGGGI